MRASRAAGSSEASWNSAVERAWPGWMPRSFSRCPRWPELTGRPGCPPGNSQGEGPGGDGGVPVLAVQELPGEAGDGFGQGNRCRAEADLHRRAAGGDMTGGQAGDPGDGLSVEQDEGPGEPVPGVDRVVVQQAAGRVPAGLVVQRPDRAVPPDGGDGYAG